MTLRASSIKEIFPKPPHDIDREALDVSNIPEHVAIIMDGNGRWAKERGLERGEGHKAGVKSVKEIGRACNSLGINYLTIYAFSTENWNRPETEVDGLMDLFTNTVNAEIVELLSENVQIRLLGRIDQLPLLTRTTLRQAEKRSLKNTGLTFCVAVNYGSRAEIVDACKATVNDVQNGIISVDDIDEDTISSRLYTAHIPDPDLLIRTSGELRLSNYLLWQLAYSEFYITDTYWPDFDRYELLRALIIYQNRNRRFGKL